MTNTLSLELRGRALRTRKTSRAGLFKKTLLLGTLLAVGAWSTAHAADKTYEIDFNNWLASTSAIAVGAFEPWKKLVEEKTDGRVKVNLYHGGVLGQSKTVLDDVRGGVYTVGYSVPSYWYDSPYFTLTIGELPFAFDDNKVSSAVMSEFAQKYSKDIFEKLGVKDMGVTTTDPYVIFGVKPIRTIDDMKNKKIRVPGRTFVQMLKEWGAVPTPMPNEDTYTALERGTLDAAYYSPSGARGWKYNEVAPYMTMINTPVIVLNPIMNQQFFDALPEDLQKQFDEELNPALIDLIVKTYSEDIAKTVSVVEERAEKGRGEVIRLTDEEREPLIAATKQDWDNWIKEADKRGLNGEQLMSDFKEIMKSHGANPPF